MANQLIADWTREGRKFLVGDIARETPLWLPTAMFIHRFREYEGRDSALPSWQSRLRDVVDRESPLGEEQTRWGFVRWLASREYLLFMTSQKSLQQTVSGHNGESQVRFWYPGVLALFDRAAKSSEWRFLLEKQCITAVLFEAGKTFPAQVISRFYEGGGIQRDWKELYATLKQEVLQKAEGELQPLRRLVSSEIWVNGARLDLKWEEWNEEQQQWGSPAHAVIKSELLRTGNLRPLSVPEQRQIQEARFNQVAWWGLLGLIASLLLLGGLYADLLWKGGRNHRLADEIRERRDQVKQIEAANSELAFLRGLERERGNPFDWMLVLNHNRPAAVVLDNFTIREGRSITVRGTAGQPANVSAFRENLEKTGEFSKISLVTGRSDQAGAGFTLELEGIRYKPVWKPAPAETPEGEAAEGESGTSETEETTPPEPENNSQNETSSVQRGSEQEVNPS